jgi:hypothetical protein
VGRTQAKQTNRERKKGGWGMSIERMTVDLDHATPKRIKGGDFCISALN